ncbi:MAG: ABC-type polysaccharide/polyol phosphate export permease, partial [Myxococcota bacterium]
SILPITHALEAMRGALLTGQSIGDLSRSLTILFVFTAVVLPVALWSFKRALHQLRVEGSVSHY